MWKLLQTTIVIAVLFSNVYWQWTPNGYVAMIYAGGTAFVVTVGLTALLDRVRAVRARYRRARAREPVLQDSRGDQKQSYFE